MPALIFLFLLLSCTVYQGSSQTAPGYQSMMDNAWIRFIYNKETVNPANPGPSQLIATYILSECYQCLDQLIVDVPATNLSQNSNINFTIFPTNYTGTFYFYTYTTPVSAIGPYGQALASIDYDIDQNGNYTILITDNYDFDSGDWKSLNIQIQTDVEGDNIWVPVFIAAAIFIVPTIAYNLYLFWRKKQKQNKIHDGEYFNQDSSSAQLVLNSRPNSVSPNQDAPAKPASKSVKERLQSLDTFRGTALAIMLFVNSGAGAYVQLDHSAWNGLHLADLVFPWFIWMMGVSMAISFASQRKRGASNKDMLIKAAIRTFKLAFFNMMMNGTKAANHLRIPGVLMRFAISYFVIAVIVIYVPKKSSSEKQESPSPFAFLTDHLYELIPIGIMLGLWLGLTFGLQVPGCPTGYIGAGGLLGDYGAYPNCTGGAAGYIDYQFLGVNHIYQHPTAQPIYLTQAYDPEGTLGCLTSIIMVYIGLMAGRVIVYHKTHKERLIRWGAGAVVLGIITVILTEGKKNGGFIPINKNMWSLSFITCLASFALIILPALYAIVDIFKVWAGNPFRAMGMNSITIYVGSNLFAIYFPFSTQMVTVNGYYNPSNDTHAWCLFRDLKNTIVWLLVAVWMDYEKFYVNV